uniref:tyrosine-protein kinase family protein n=1 Tax=Thaumasiovibrio occultus TaxID=1891184 RepID=UPI000B3533DA|nr:tyrosine-protein kinase family protein [Thaumasiovibrio occultus]
MNPWLSQDFDLLFQQVQQSNAKTLVLVGAHRHCGTSTFTRWLAERFANEHKVLLIDLDMDGAGQNIPPARWRLDGEGQQQALQQVYENLTILPQPADPITILSLRQSTQLTRCLAQWQNEYDYLLFDTGTMNTSNWEQLPACALGAHCDGVILCVAAAKTTEYQLQQCSLQFSQAKVPLLGTVINDSDYPTLSSEISHTITHRCHWLPKPLKRWLLKRLANSPLLRGDYQA